MHNRRAKFGLKIEKFPAVWGKMSENIRRVDSHCRWRVTYRDGLLVMLCLFSVLSAVADRRWSDGRRQTTKQEDLERDDGPRRRRRSGTATSGTGPRPSGSDLGGRLRVLRDLRWCWWCKRIRLWRRRTQRWSDVDRFPVRRPEIRRKF